MSKDFYYILPPAQNTMDVLEAHQITIEFRQEVRYREDLERYCQWYYDTARQHRRELEKMRRDPNILGWFYRSKR